MDVPLAYHLARLTGRPIKPRRLSPGTSASSITRAPTGRSSPARTECSPAPTTLEAPTRSRTSRSKPSASTRTSRPAATCAPGHPQVAFAVEAHMDLLARAVGLDPLEFRLPNG